MMSIAPGVSLNSNNAVTSTPILFCNPSLLSVRPSVSFVPRFYSRLVRGPLISDRNDAYLTSATRGAGFLRSASGLGIASSII